MPPKASSAKPVDAENLPDQPAVATEQLADD
eukprot:COSAG01_NODE_39465_length_476_cov_0.671088_2_plen_30_part_01